jgi:hypothetical protein
VGVIAILIFVLSIPAQDLHADTIRTSYDVKQYEVGTIFLHPGSLTYNGQSFIREVSSGDVQSQYELISINSPSAVANSAPLLKFSEQSYGVSFQYPSNWKIDERVFPDAVPNVIGSSPIVTLRPTNNPENVWVDVFVAELFPVLGEFGKLSASVQLEIQSLKNAGFSIEAVDQTSLGGNDAYGLVFKQPLSSFKNREVITHVNGKEYRFWYLALPELYETYLDDVRVMHNSFEISGGKFQ